MANGAHLAPWRAGASADGGPWRWSYAGAGAAPVADWRADWCPAAASDSCRSGRAFRRTVRCVAAKLNHFKKVIQIYNQDRKIHALFPTLKAATLYRGYRIRQESFNLFHIGLTIKSKNFESKILFSLMPILCLFESDTDELTSHHYAWRLITIWLKAETGGETMFNGTIKISKWHWSSILVVIKCEEVWYSHCTSLNVREICRVNGSP